jgi:uncharacterized protein (DUF2336 family)
MLERLARLSADASSEGRRELLNAVTDLFLIDESPSDTASEHYADIAGRSLSNMGGADRAAYAERVAEAPTLPNSVAKTLANDDEFAVAHLVLKLSPVLTDADLAAIAVTHPQSHLLAIAERVSLSESVTDILVERGNQKVLRTVSGNEGANFSDGGLGKLIERGGNDIEIAKNLSRRKDSLPATQAKRVLQIAAQISMSASAPEYGTEIIKDEPQKRVVRQAREKRLEVRLLIADLKENKRQLDDVVIALAEEDRAFDIVQVLSTVADIPNPQILRALLQKEASGIAVACRSVGLGAKAFRSVLELRSSRLNLPAGNIEKDMASYENLPAALSDRAMRFLKMRSTVA